MKHYIIIQFNERVQDLEAMTDEVRAFFQPVMQIEGVHSVSVRPAVIRSDKRYDLMILMELERSALPAYDQSELHRLWKERYTPFFKQKTIFDCD